MALEHSNELQRYSPNGVRRMGYLEAGVQPEPERISGSGRSSMHDSVGQGSRHLHPVRAWLIIGFIIFNIGAVCATIYLCTQS
jgi:hypothetical protein